MAVKIKKKPTKTKTVAKPVKKTAKKTTSNGAASNGKLTVAERHALAQCIAPKDKKCPAVNHKESSFMYQQGCRAEPCRIANRAYYRNWRARKAAAVTKAAKRKTVVKKKTTPKKTVAKKTTAKR